jgi:hypothetical protein
VLSPLDLAGCPQSTPIRRRGGLRPSSSFGKKGGMSCYEYGAHDSIGPYGPGAVGYREGDEYRDASRLSWEDSSDEGDSGRDVRVTMVHTSDDDPSVCRHFCHSCVIAYFRSALASVRISLMKTAIHWIQPRPPHDLHKKYFPPISTLSTLPAVPSRPPPSPAYHLHCHPSSDPSRSPSYT